MVMLSVIVPVYNVEKYLPTCIESILKQTMEELELILVDDGSTDRSSLICDEYAKTDLRIKVIHQKNGGLSAARNTGLRSAQGRYISFVDSDDFIRQDMYEVLLNELQKEQADFIKSDFIEYFEGDDIQCKDDIKAINVYTSIEAIKDFFETEFSNRKPMKSTVWDAVYDRNIFFEGDKLVVGFPLGKINEDTYVFPKLILRAKKILHIGTAFYYYRKRAGSIMHSGMSEREILSYDLWDSVEKDIEDISEEYRGKCIENSALRKINILNRIYNSDYENQYFNMIRGSLFENEEKYKKYVTDKRLLRTLRVIKHYPMYVIVKRILGDRIY